MLKFGLLLSGDGGKYDKLDKKIGTNQFGKNY